MIKPQDFDTAQGFSSFEPLQAGGHICKIMKVEETKSKAGKDIKQSVFTPFDKLIMIYLSDIYMQDAIQFILFEWLAGNKSALRVPIDTDIVVTYPLETVEDLYTVMELYKKS